MKSLTLKSKLESEVRRWAPIAFVDSILSRNTCRHVPVIFYSFCFHRRVTFIVELRVRVNVSARSISRVITERYRYW